VATRDPWLDNAKMALVTLVVIGHTWVLLPDTTTNNWLYDFLYSWHVPAFVFVTGYLSRSFTWAPRRLRALVTTVVVPYIVFESFIALFRIRFGDEQLEGIFADPHWPMWYLSALFFWRLMTPIFRARLWAVPVAVLISLGAGIYAGDTLDTARVLGLLPFFVLGLHATPERLERLHHTRARVVGLAVLAAIFVLARFTDVWINTEWLYYRSRYDELALSDPESVLVRAVLILIGVAGTFAFLAFVPRVEGWFSRMGRWTLVVYLFHGFVVKSAEYLDFDTWAAGQPLLSLPVATAAATALALLLAWAPLARRLNYVVDPYGEILRATAPRRAHRSNERSGGSA
jgi:fucose 4-O-acetylase-like acetyltransferase